ncbi:MAG: DNA replication/repair protein RecF [Phototrophicaceae bacterium]|jgi:DNA replication and repair protein RecF
MQVDHLSLENFRNYARLELAIPKQTVILTGENAQGKTSLLEALYFLATARSPYTTLDRQLVHWRTENDPIPFARVAADVQTASMPIGRVEITVVLEGNGASVRSRKVVRINGVEKRVLDLVGLLAVVLFLPQDLRLIEGGPADRRRYLDDTLSQVDAAYQEALSNYERVLTQRNALLRNIAAGRSSAKELGFWDEQLAAAGAVLVGGRQRFLREMEYNAQRVHLDLTNRAETLTLHYQPSFAPTASPNGQMSLPVFGLDLHRQLSVELIAEQFMAHLSRERNESIQRGVTLAGPHRDDLRMHINGRDVSLYGSRGQSRTTVLGLKLAELQWMTEKIGERPLLLLDEVVAELDTHRREYLLAQFQSGVQTLLTTTEPDLLPTAFLAQSVQWQITAGQITPVTQP